MLENCRLYPSPLERSERDAGLIQPAFLQAMAYAAGHRDGSRAARSPGGGCDSWHFGIARQKITRLRLDEQISTRNLESAYLEYQVTGRLMFHTRDGMFAVIVRTDPSDGHISAAVVPIPWVGEHHPYWSLSTAGEPVAT